MSYFISNQNLARDVFFQLSHKFTNYLKRWQMNSKDFDMQPKRINFSFLTTVFNNCPTQRDIMFILMLQMKNPKRPRRIASIIDDTQATNNATGTNSSFVLRYAIILNTKKKTSIANYWTLNYSQRHSTHFRYFLSFFLPCSLDQNKANFVNIIIKLRQILEKSIES